MDTYASLNNLVGKQGLLHVRCGVDCFETEFTFLSVNAVEGPPSETDECAFEDAITKSQFTVRFDDGTLVEGSNTRVISGRYISRIMDPAQRKTQ